MEASKPHFVDVHTHLTHERFDGDRADVIARAKAADVTALVVNGLEPISNRQILEMAAEDSVVKPALGIYPIDAVNGMVAGKLPFSVATFNVDDEIEFIRGAAKAGKLFAIGECGLDGYWVGADTFPEQERVFIELIKIAKEFDLPIIIHTRKREPRCVEILIEQGVKRVDFHCYGGKVGLALRCAKEYGWWFSIPANAQKNEAFTKMLKELPEDRILTETDAPFLAPVKGERNEPQNVVGTVNYLAELRGWTQEQAKETVWRNFNSLFRV